MVSEKRLKKLCKDDITKIENYEKALNDETQMWVCHHRLELTMDNQHAVSRDDLKRMGMYYHRPYFELILLTHKEHQTLHNRTDKAREGISKAMRGNKNRANTKVSKDRAINHEYYLSRKEEIKTRTNAYYHNNKKENKPDNIITLTTTKVA